MRRAAHKQTTLYICCVLFVTYKHSINILCKPQRTDTNEHEQIKSKQMFDHKMVIDVIHFMEKRMFVRALA